MKDFAQLKKRLYIVLAVLCVMDVALLIYMVLPGSSTSELRAKKQTLQAQVDELKREVAPLKGLDIQLVQTRQDIKGMYQDRIPSQWSQVSAALQRVTHETGVNAQSIKYSVEHSDKGDLPNVQRVEIDTTVSGDYAKVARFINALEQEKLFFVIRQITLNSAQESGTVTLQIKFGTFLKEAA
ncbi:MAG TPA: type 4a pilus biogenesis protein PilO [Candidatus Angelobacter sp.]|jgi:Tfp pilus assembly protein PilO|nr:type 4a pilus biogenesis protein PilO [Candidatus Angelobacter sp.]